MDVGLVLAALTGAMILAEIGAWFFRRQSPDDSSEMNIGPWWSVMRREGIPTGQLSYIAIAFADGTTVDGVLHNYTWSPDATHRDVALCKPITITRPGDQRWLKRKVPVVIHAPYDYIVIPAAQIKHLALKYVDRG